MYTFIPVNPSKEAWMTRPFNAFLSLKDMVNSLKEFAPYPLRGQLVFKSGSIQEFSGIKDLENIFLCRNWSSDPYEKVHFYRFGYVIVNSKN